MPTRELAACSSPCECIGTLPLQASACDERGRRFESCGRRRAELARAVGVFGLWCKGRRTGRWFERGLSPVYCRMQPPRCSLAGRGCATSPACCSSHAPCPGLPECKGARLRVWLAIRAQCTDALRRLPRARLANRSPPLVSLVSAGRRYQRRERVEISGFGWFFVHRRVARARAHNATARVALDRLTFHDDSASQGRNTVEHSR